MVLSVSDISNAEILVMKLTQRKYMQDELNLLSKVQPNTSRDQIMEIHKCSLISKLNTFLNFEGLL